MPSGKKPDYNRSQCKLFDDGTPLKSGNTTRKKRSSEHSCSKSSVMYCDGASRGNPGHAGIGVVIYLSGKEGLKGRGNEITLSRYIGVATNNVAEYSALIAGLEKAVSLGINKLEVFLDSELLVRQINGIYKVKNRNLKPLWVKAMNILKGFDVYEVRHVRRELNREADALAREGIKKGRK